MDVQGVTHITFEDVITELYNLKAAAYAHNTAGVQQSPSTRNTSGPVEYCNTISNKHAQQEDVDGATVVTLTNNDVTKEVLETLGNTIGHLSRLKSGKAGIDVGKQKDGTIVLVCKAHGGPLRGSVFHTKKDGTALNVCGAPFVGFVSKPPENSFPPYTEGCYSMLTAAAHNALIADAPAAIQRQRERLQKQKSPTPKPSPSRFVRK